MAMKKTTTTTRPAPATPRRNPNDVPLGTGLAQRARVAINNRQAQLDAQEAAAMGGGPRKKPR